MPGLLAGVERVVDGLLHRREQRLRRVVEAEQVAVLGEELGDRDVALLLRELGRGGALARLAGSARGAGPLRGARLLRRARPSERRSRRPLQPRVASPGAFVRRFAPDFAGSRRDAASTRRSAALGPSSRRRELRRRRAGSAMCHTPAPDARRSRGEAWDVCPTRAAGAQAAGVLAEVLDARAAEVSAQARAARCAACGARSRRPRARRGSPRRSRARARAASSRASPRRTELDEPPAAAARSWSTLPSME